MPLDSSGPRAKGVARPNPVSPTHEVGRQRILKGDCLARLREMPDGTFDLIVTSPPYNMARTQQSCHKPPL